jgi:hypothetical protein
MDCHELKASFISDMEGRLAEIKPLAQFVLYPPIDRLIFDLVCDYIRQGNVGQPILYKTSLIDLNCVLFDALVTHLEQHLGKLDEAHNVAESDWNNVLGMKYAEFRYTANLFQDMKPIYEFHK